MIFAGIVGTRSRRKLLLGRVPGGSSRGGRHLLITLAPRPGRPYLVEPGRLKAALDSLLGRSGRGAEAVTIPTPGRIVGRRTGPSSTLVTAGWIAVALGLATAAAGGGSMIWAGVKRSRHDKLVREGGDSQRVIQELGVSANGATEIARPLLVAGGAAAVLGLGLALLAPRVFIGRPSGRRSGGAVGPGGGGRSALWLGARCSAAGGGLVIGGRM